MVNLLLFRLGLAEFLDAPGGYSGVEPIRRAIGCNQRPCRDHTALCDVDAGEDRHPGSKPAAVADGNGFAFKGLAPFGRGPESVGGCDEGHLHGEITARTYRYSGEAIEEAIVVDECSLADRNIGATEEASRGNPAGLDSGAAHAIKQLAQPAWNQHRGANLIHKHVLEGRAQAGSKLNKHGSLHVRGKRSARCIGRIRCSIVGSTPPACKVSS